MRNHLYYREIADKMSNRIFENPDRMDQINDMICNPHDTQDNIYTICARAASVFRAVEELSEDHLVDWDNALDEYTDDIIDHIFTGDNIDNLDMISMASQSGLSVR